MILLGVMAAGAAGAMLRYAVDGLVVRRWRSSFPAGTFVVNVSGAFLLGLSTAALGAPARTILGTGLVGSYTTFSTWMWETLLLLRGRARLLAALNVLASVAAGLGAAALGRAIG